MHVWVEHTLNAQVFSTSELQANTKFVHMTHARENGI